MQIDAPLLQKRKTKNPIVVTVANGEKASSTHEGFLDVPGLPPAARNAHVIPGIKHSLLSIVRLSNAGCEIKFHRWGTGVEVRYRGKTVLRGRKSTINGLWYVPITQNIEVNPIQDTNAAATVGESANHATKSATAFLTTSTKELHTPRHTICPNGAIKQQIAANATTLPTTFTKSELAMYHHQSLGNPTKETLLKGLRKHPSQFQTFPGLTYELISNHLPPSEATEKGHMIMTRKGLRSTRTMAKRLAKTRRDVSNFLPEEEVCLAEEDEIYCYAILGDNNENTIYSDLTGRFPVESFDGKKTTRGNVLKKI